MSTQPSRIRIGHAEREQAVERLQLAAADGRLTHDELDARVGQALAAMTRGDLDAVLGDLGGLDASATSATSVALASPAAHPITAAPQRPVSAGWSWSDPLVFAAKWDSVKRVGAWRIPPFLEVDARVENVYLNCVDAAALAPVIDVQLAGGAGKVVFVVPPGWGADLTRVSKRVGALKSSAPEVAEPGQPQLVLRGKNPMDGVRVRTPNRLDTWNLDRARSQPSGVLTKG